MAAKAIFEVQIKQRKGPLSFCVYMDTAGKAIALAKSFEGDKDYIAFADLNKTRVVFDSVLDAHVMITEKEAQ